MRILTVTVHPDSTRDDVVAVNENAFKVYVTQSSKQGKANKTAMIKLAQFLGVPPAKLILSRGDRSNNKTVILLDD